MPERSVGPLQSLRCPAVSVGLYFPHDLPPPPLRPGGLQHPVEELRGVWHGQMRGWAFEVLSAPLASVVARCREGWETR